MSMTISITMSIAIGDRITRLAIRYYLVLLILVWLWNRRHPS